MKTILYILLWSFTFGPANLSYGQIDKIQSLINSGNELINSDIKVADSLYQEAIKLAEQSNQDSLKANALLSRAVAERYRGDYRQAIKYNEEAVLYFIKNNDSLSISTAFHNLGVVYRYTDDFISAGEYFDKAIEIRSSIKDTVQWGLSLIQAGIIKRLQEDYSEARRFYTEALRLFRLSGRQELIVHANGNLSFLELNLKNYQKSIELNLQDIPYLIKVNNLKSLATRYGNIGLAYRRLEQPDKAIAYYNKSIEICKNEGYNDKLKDNFLQRSRSYNSLKNHEAAFKDYREYIKIRDQLNNLDNVKELEKSKAQLEYSIKKSIDSLQIQHELTSLSLQKSNASRERDFFIFLSLLIIISAGSLWFHFKQRNKLLKVALDKEQIQREMTEQNLLALEKEADRIVEQNNIKTLLKQEVIDQLEIIQNTEEQARSLNKLIRKLKRQLSMEREKLFQNEELISYSETFESKLIEVYPSLTKTEREMCKLIRLNLTNKEIEITKNMTPDAVKSTRYRIRKKMNLTRKEELVQALKKIAHQ